MLTEVEIAWYTKHLLGSKSANPAEESHLRGTYRDTELLKALKEILSDIDRLAGVGTGCLLLEAVDLLLEAVDLFYGHDGGSGERCCR